MFRSAAALGLFSCSVCGLVSRCTAGDARPVRETFCCPRCTSRLSFRKPDSLNRTAALLIAAGLLYVPANTLPVMDTHSLFNAQRDTIMSGVIYLWNSGSWEIAVIVFFASIVIPLLKLVVLGYLVVSVQRGSRVPPLRRARLYRLLASIGRWSMLDIYVVAILVSLVRIETLAVITAGAGTLCFGAVVVLTMLATLSFDPRLLWDPLTPRRG
jgi:paraquat-inducible protein A